MHMRRFIFSCDCKFFIIILLLGEFFTLTLADGFYWSLSDNKSPQVSRTLLNILDDITNAVIWIFSASTPISKSSSPFTNPLWIVPCPPITIGSTVTLIFHIYLNSLTWSRYSSLFSLSFNFTL